MLNAWVHFNAGSLEFAHLHEPLKYPEKKLERALGPLKEPLVYPLMEAQDVAGTSLLIGPPSLRFLALQPEASF